MSKANSKHEEPVITIIADPIHAGRVAVLIDGVEWDNFPNIQAALAALMEVY